MNELISNISLYFGETEIEGCTELKSSVNTKKEGIYEYLCSQPYAYTSVEEERLITLTLRGNFCDYSGITAAPFRITDGTACITYGTCRIISDKEYSRDGVFYRELCLGCSDRSVENG